LCKESHSSHHHELINAFSIHVEQETCSVLAYPRGVAGHDPLREMGVVNVYPRGNGALNR
jgi:hypothetical protein